jgi:hypothetical protein
MKKLLKALFVFMLIFNACSNIVYLCICFIFWEINPSEWPEHGRSFLAFFGYFVVGFVLAIGFTAILKIENKI